MRNIERPKIVLLDLETLPDLREVLKVYPGLSAYPGLTLKATTCSIICGGWKIFEDKKTNCFNAWDYPTWNYDVNDDRQLCEDLYNVLVDAHAIITHNGKSFDWKFLQTRLLKNDLPPLPTITHIDTKILARSNILSFNNKLQTLAQHFTDKEKLENGGWDLWVQVHNKDPKAMKLMEKYCKQDVLVLEELFKVLRPFAKNIPNYNLFALEKVNCPYCGSLSIMKQGTRPTKTKLNHRYTCKDCHGWFSIPERSSLPRT